MKITSQGMIVRIAVASAEGVTERWMHQYDNDKWAGTDKETISKRLAAADSNASADEVAAIIGNKSWTHPRCDSHGDYVDRAVVIGEDYEDGKKVCLNCLRSLQEALQTGESK